MLMKSTCFGLVLACSQAYADPLSVTKTYVYTDPEFESRDKACISAFEEEITPKFMGLTEIQLDAKFIFRTKDGAVATYADVIFVSDYGNASGSLNCVFARDRQTVTDVAVLFLDGGLGGLIDHVFKPDPDDPATWKIPAVSVTVSR